MKKLLSILGSFGMIATSSTSVIACDTDAFKMSVNPSNKEQLIKLMEENKTLDEDTNNVMDELRKEGIVFTDRENNPFADSNLQKNSYMQELAILIFISDALDIKITQYMLTLDEKSFEAFAIENEELLENFYVSFSYSSQKEELDEMMRYLDESFDSFNSDETKALTKTTLKGIKNIVNWAKDNKFKA